MFQRNPSLCCIMYGIIKQRPVIYIRKQHTFLMIVMILNSEVQCWNLSTLIIDGSVIVSIQLAFFAVDFEIDFKYCTPSTNVRGQWPLLKRLKNICRTRWFLCRYVSTENNARRIFRTYSVPISFETIPGLPEKVDFFKSLQWVLLSLSWSCRCFSCLKYLHWSPILENDWLLPLVRSTSPWN